jgi:hypothetical protein
VCARARAGVQLTNLRSKLVKVACVTTSEMAAVLQQDFEALADPIVANLLKLVPLPQLWKSARRFAAQRHTH